MQKITVAQVLYALDHNPARISDTANALMAQGYTRERVRDVLYDVFDCFCIHNGGSGHGEYDNGYCFYHGQCRNIEVCYSYWDKKWYVYGQHNP